MLYVSYAVCVRALAQGARTDAARIGTVPHLPPALTTDLIISYLKLVRQKRKTSQFSSKAQRQ